MAKVGVQRAADLTGKSKSTIQRAMRDGKLSFEMDKNDRKVIDVSELERVYGLKQSSGPSQNGALVEAELEKAANMLEMERLKMRVKMLEHQLENVQGTAEDLREQRDEWQKQAQQILITSQHSQKQADEYKAEVKAREDRARQRREQMMAERTRRQQAQNENRQAATQKTTENGGLQKNTGIQGLLGKMRKKKAA